MTAANARTTVFVVDDDAAVRRSLARLIGSAGFEVEALPSAGAFLERTPPEGPSCLVLDVRMDGLTGPQLQRRLTQMGHRIPIVFITGHGDVPMSVQAMKDGAVDFLQKPFDDGDLLAAIERAIQRDRFDRVEHDEIRRLQNRYALLTPREREVLGLIVTGRPNRQVAHELGVVEKTIKVHRARVMTKMRAGSLVELARFAHRLDLTPSP